MRTPRVKARAEHLAFTIEVADEGPGIAMDERERVFEPFFQGSAPYHSAVKGTGLGLAIVKEFVAAHQGTVEIVADARPGTRIRVRLPQPATVRQIDPPEAAAA